MKIRAANLGRTRHRGAFSLVEAIVCVALVGGVFVATIRTVGAAANAQRSRALRVQGSALAQELLTEILQASYKEPVDTPAFGRETGESASARAAWDDVDDYNAFAETTTLTRKYGTAVGGGGATTGWKWEAAVAYADPANPANASATDAGLKRITVTVTDPRGRQTRLEALRSSTGAYDQPADVTLTHVTRIGLKLQIGPDTRSTVTSAVNLLNEVK
jgi:type II secretory pathway pseudopilin PulG